MKATNTQATEVTMCDCGHAPSAHGEHTTGYITIDGKTTCYECCAKLDAQWMREKGKITLYLTTDGDKATVGNWPGSLKFSAFVRKGRHNIARTRYDVWFIGPDHAQWHGVQYGENTQICHCRRIKATN